LTTSFAQCKDNKREHVTQGKPSNNKELKWYPLNVKKSSKEVNKPAPQKDVKP
jgi:hypothetical protein